MRFHRVTEKQNPGANGGTRTPDQLITNQLLYQLSYIGLIRNMKKRHYLPSSVFQTLYIVKRKIVVNSGFFFTRCFVAEPCLLAGRLPIALAITTFRRLASRKNNLRIIQHIPLDNVLVRLLRKVPISQNESILDEIFTFLRSADACVSGD